MMRIGPAMFREQDIRREWKRADVLDLKAKCEPMLDEVVGKERWVMDESDYGFALAVMFKRRRDDDNHGLHLAYVDRREGEDGEPPPDNRSYILTVEQARAIIEDNL